MNSTASTSNALMSTETHRNDMHRHASAAAMVRPGGTFNQEINLNIYKQIAEALLTGGRLDYGSVIHKNELMKEAGIDPLTDAELKGMAPKDIIKAANKEQLMLLGLAGAIRDAIIPLGRYFGQRGDSYYVALPSENARIASNYVDSGSRKIARAQKLLAATPAQTEPREQANTQARALSASLRATNIAKKSGE